MAVVDLRHEEDVAVLSLDRPPVNAIDLALVEELESALVREASSTAKALVLTGRGQAFTAGIDTKAIPAYSLDERQRMVRAVNRMVKRLYAFAKPVVAVVNGHALGGGLVLALACDRRVAARGDARLGLTEVSAGIPYPAGPMVVVRRELSPEVARDLVLSGREITVEEAMTLGVLDEAHDPGRAIARGVELARSLATPVYGRVKQQLREEGITETARIVAADDDPLLDHWIEDD